MRKITLFTTFVLLFIGIYFCGINIKKVSACLDWCEPECTHYASDGSCDGYYSTACCDPDGGAGNYCLPGQYSCNKPGGRIGCCNVGSGGGGGGSSGPGCVERSAHCGPGETIALNSPVYTDCFMQWGGEYCSPPGSAQRTTGCCTYGEKDENGVRTCISPQYTTYSCCPAGTTETKHTGTTYTKVNTCFGNGPTTCNDPSDEYVSFIQAPSAGVCYVACSEENPNTGNCRVGKEYNVYNAITTCRTVTYSCDNTCTATAPSNLTVVSGTTPGTTALMSWSPATGAGVGTYQLIRVGTDAAEVASGCPGNAGRPACVFSGTVDSNISSKEIVGLTESTPYYFRVVNYKDIGCYKDTVTMFTTPQATGTIAGTVYLDAFNTCSISSPTMDGVSVVMDGTTTDVSGPNGAYSFAAQINSSHTLNVSLPSGYNCSNGTGCAGNSCAVSGIVSPFGSRNFFLTLNRSAWWQAEGASIYAGSTAGGTTISSSIPSSVGASSRYLVLPGSGGTPALVMRATGNDPSVGEGGVNENSWSARSSYKGKKMDYQYFASQMGVLKNQVSDWGGNGLNQQNSDERDFWYMKPSAGPGNISSAWVVGSNDSYVVFVDGDLEIDSNITVQPGGFLAFVVNGDITVGSLVDSLQGIFIANNDFVTESNYVSGSTNDIALEVEGTVVAWGTTSFGRNLGTGNVTTPAEKFSYRPDFLVNMPAKMKAFALEWTEVVAGTIEN